jgi:hypothetical protein
MTEYVIDIIVENVWISPNMRNTEYTFYIKIDANGNVDIKQRFTNCQTGQPNTFGPIQSIVTINDNNPIPSYIIYMLKNSFCQPTARTNVPGVNNSCCDQLFLHHYLNAIENIIILKENMAKGSEKLIDIL